VYELALGFWEAMPQEALFGILVAAPVAWLVARRLRGRGASLCARCGEGYRVEALEPLGGDGAHVCVRCPSCKVWYAVATTNRDVFKVDDNYVAARWPDVPVERRRERRRPEREPTHPS